MFAEKIKAARRAKKMTQKELADLLNVDRSTVAHYENGTAKPQFDSIRRLSEVLDLTYSELLDD